MWTPTCLCWFFSVFQDIYHRTSSPVSKRVQTSSVDTCHFNHRAHLSVFCSRTLTLAGWHKSPSWSIKNGAVGLKNFFVPFTSLRVFFLAMVEKDPTFYLSFPSCSFALDIFYPQCLLTSNPSLLCIYLFSQIQNLRTEKLPAAFP